MSKDHVGTPRFIQEEFAINGKTHCYFLKQEKLAFVNVRNLGVENQYFSKDVEQKILANDIESRFGIFYKKLINEPAMTNVIQQLISNRALIQTFISFMYMRSKITLKLINENSIYSKLIAQLSHSEAIQINAEIKINFLDIINEDYVIIPIKSYSIDNTFINNSIGLGIKVDIDANVSVFMPLNSQLMLMFMGVSCAPKNGYYIISTENEEMVSRINQIMSITELQLGNGYIFGKNGEVINRCASFFTKKRKTILD